MNIEDFHTEVIGLEIRISKIINSSFINVTYIMGNKQYKVECTKKYEPRVRAFMILNGYRFIDSQELFLHNPVLFYSYYEKVNEQVSSW